MKFLLVGDSGSNIDLKVKSCQIARGPLCTETLPPSFPLFLRARRSPAWPRGALLAFRNGGLRVAFKAPGMSPQVTVAVPVPRPLPWKKVAQRVDALPEWATFPMNALEGTQEGGEPPPPRARTPQPVVAGSWCLRSARGPVPERGTCHERGFYQGDPLSLPEWLGAPESDRFSH